MKTFVKGLGIVVLFTVLFMGIVRLFVFDYGNNEQDTKQLTYDYQNYYLSEVDDNVDYVVVDGYDDNSIIFTTYDNNGKVIYTSISDRNEMEKEVKNNFTKHLIKEVF